MNPPNPSRREFLEKAALTGIGLAAVNALKGAHAPLEGRAREAGAFNMSGYAAPKIATVRIGLVGTGNRGSRAVSRLSKIDGLELKALCDVRRGKVEAAAKTLAGTVSHPELYADDAEAWKRMCEREDIDLIYICTPWRLHTPMAVYAMEHGKHVAVEVPAALTLAECWQLVETSERTRRHCKMLENCCYDFFELLTLNMVRQGFFGEIVHGEGAYLHHHVMEEEFDRNYYSEMWRLKENVKRNGNLYPTHGLGPICQAMNINRGDRLDFLSSVSTNDFSMGKMAADLAAKDAFYRPYVGAHFRGNLNTSIIRTVQGRSIMLQHDVSTTQPYSRVYRLTGTRALAYKWPLPPRIAVGEEWASEAQMKQWEEKYTPALVRTMGKMAEKVGGHGGMDFLMDWRMIDCLRNGLPLDHNVYDAATWSSVGPLSEWSVAHRSNSIDVPDFTHGHWRTNQPADMGLV